MNSAKWTWLAIGYQCMFAYTISLIVYQFGLFIAGSGFTVFTALAITLTVLLMFLLLWPYKEPQKLTLAVEIE